MAATATARRSTATAPARRPAPRKRRSNTPSGGFVPVAAVGGAVGGLADSGLFVWLTRGRLWIGLLGALLVGIVGLNVMALSFSASSSNAGQTADELRRANSAMRADIAARLSNSEIQAVAADLGLMMPAAGSIGYLDSSPGDAAKAAQRLRDGELSSAGAVSETTVDSTLVGTTAVDPATEVPVETTEAPVTTTETPVDPATAVAADPAATSTATETAAPPADTSLSGGAVSAP